MASKFFCDRCGKEIQFVPTEVTVFRRTKKEDTLPEIVKSFDLCENCEEDVVRFIMGKK